MVGILHASLFTAELRRKTCHGRLGNDAFTFEDAGLKRRAGYSVSSIRLPSRTVGDNDATKAGAGGRSSGA